MADDPKPEVIEEEMAQTRSSLVEKIAALEHQVVSTVQSATTAVQETVQSVTNAVQDTTTTVKQSILGVQDEAHEAIHGLKSNLREVFDVSAHVRENPVPMVAGAAVVGFVTGLLVFGRSPRLAADMNQGSEPAPPPYRPSYAAGYVAPGSAPEAAPQANPHPVASRRPGWVDELLQRAGQEIVKLGEQALSKAVAQARTAIDQQVPKLVDNLVAGGAQKVSGLVGQHHDTTTATRRM